MADPGKQQQFRERVRRDWDDPVTIAGWKKWGASSAEFLAGVNRAIVETAGAAPGQAILDIASGAGQPALMLARAVAPGGTVTATDLSAGMLAVVEENAQREKLSNVRVKQADVESLPFPNASFDRVTCRFGAMFFIDPARAMGECLRVLTPGGKAVFVVWGPPQQPFFVPAAILRKFVDIPEPEPGAPHIFRYAAPGSLSEVLRQAGFTQVHEDARKIPCERVGTPESAWQEFYDMAAPFRPLIAGLPPARRAELDAAALAALRQFVAGDRMKLHVDVNVVVGDRP